ncbi:Protein kinase domain family protein [Leishmania donovani]|uniref:Protein kinase domain family protein n=1 Tax=Leishmania donovani TaxID=5661 RepID=A0A504XGG0_LEIDO|nr:Protein kinase domain family protein [Leishmania donovani]
MTSYGIDGEVEQRYRILRHIGSGAYGVVWCALDRRTGKCVALKKVYDAFGNVQDAQRTYREVMLLQRLRHNPFIVGILDVIRAANDIDLYLVFELIETDLTAIIRKNLLQRDHKRFLTYQLLRTVAQLHAQNIHSPGFEAGNIFVSSDCSIKLGTLVWLARFAAASTTSRSFSDLTDYIATRWYRDGHVAIGCVIGEMLLGHPLFEGRNTLDQLRLIVEAIGVPSDADLIVFNPKRRLSAVEALQHPYVAPFVQPGELEKIQDLDPLVLPSSALQPSPPALQRSKLGVSGTTSDDSTHNGQLETFLRERLENWDKEAAEVIMVWGRLGGMCSSEYQSQLRKARTTLSETNKKEKRRDTSALQARDDSKTDGHQSHRDRLAAEYWARTQAKLNAAQQQRGRQLRRQQRLQANGQAPVSLSSVSQRTPPVFSGQVHTLRAASTSVSPRLTAARASTCLSHQHLPPVLLAAPDAPAEAASRSRRDFTLSGAGSEGSDGSSSLILSTTDEEQVSAVASTPTAATSQPSSSFSGTFIVRRRLSVHGQPSSSSTPAHQTCQRSSSTTSDATQEDRADGKVNAPSSVSTVDPSLPFHSRTVTAIFTYSSRSREKTSGPRRRRSTQERRLDNSAHTEQPRGEPDAEAQEAPQRSVADPSYLNRGVLEEE